MLDTAFDGVWYDHVAGRPAVDYLTADEFRAAIEFAESMRRDQAQVGS